MSLFAEYSKEYFNKDVVETDWGFAVYTINEETCYLSDIYVKKDLRDLGKATELAEVVQNIARANGCKKLLGSIVPNVKDSTSRLKVALSFGFKIQSSGDNFIWLEKEII